MAGNTVFEEALRRFKSRLSAKELQQFSEPTSLSELKGTIASSKMFSSQEVYAQSFYNNDTSSPESWIQGSCCITECYVSSGRTG